MTNKLSPMRFHAPYMEWAKTRPHARFDLAGSNILGCSIDDLPGAREALALSGDNESGYPPLMEAIARRYGVSPSQVTTAQGTSGANFMVCAALVHPGHDVLVERPGYDPLLGAPRLLGANVVRFDRDAGRGFGLDPGAVARAITPRTKLIILSSPHNPSGALTDAQALETIGQLAASHGAHVLVDEVYLDATDATRTHETSRRPLTMAAARLGDVFLSTSSLTKSYGLSGLRCGWVLSSPAIAERLRRARDVIDGTGPIVTERLGVLAFEHLDELTARAAALLRTNATMVRTFLEGRAELEWFEPAPRDDGSRGQLPGTVVFPRLRAGVDTSTFTEQLLRDRETALVPGRFFDAPGHFRLGFGGSTATLAPGLERVAAALDAEAW